MRKPRDFDSELKALAEKAKQLKVRKVQQLGELVIATGTDGLDTDILTGALLAIAENKDAAREEAWRTRGVDFFRKPSRKAARANQPDSKGNQTNASQGASR